MAQGIVKWYDPDKGFGFVAQDDGGNDVFLHHTAVGTEILAEGDRIAFDIGFGPKGDRAEGIRVIQRSGTPPRSRRLGVDSGRPAFSRNGGSFDALQGLIPGAVRSDLDGVVRHFDAERGYGFITTQASADDVFFHGSVVASGQLRAGDAVVFSLGQGPKGPRATHVRLRSE